MKDKKILYGIILVFIFLLSMGLTYAYFSVTTAVTGDRNEIRTTVTNLGEITDYYDYEEDDAGNSSSPRKVNIPSTINGVTVTSIGEDAFSQNNLISVTMSNSVTAIGDYAFYANNLPNVTIPSSVSSIGKGAFTYNNLTYACIKGKGSPTDFSYYGTNIWQNAWATTENILWNCNNPSSPG